MCIRDRYSEWSPIVITLRTPYDSDTVSKWAYSTFSSFVHATKFSHYFTWTWKVYTQKQKQNHYAQLQTAVFSCFTHCLKEGLRCCLFCLFSFSTIYIDHTKIYLNIYWQWHLLSVTLYQKHWNLTTVTSLYSYIT